MDRYEILLILSLSVIPLLISFPLMYLDINMIIVLVATILPLIPIWKYCLWKIEEVPTTKET